jgi:PAS domain S-box-containing protein
MASGRLTDHLRRMKAAYAVLIIALIPTSVVSYRLHASRHAREQARFDRIVGESRDKLERGFDRCLDQLHLMRALFAAHPDLTLDQWKAFLGELNVHPADLGIRSIGYVEKVTPATEQEFLKRRQADTRIAFNIAPKDPKGERAVYYPAVYVSHFDSTAEIIFGLDHGTRPERLEVINRAIDLNQPQATDQVRFMASDGMHTNSGIFVYLPVYKPGRSIGDAAQRRDAVQGLVYVTLVPDHLLTMLFQSPYRPEIDIEVFDGAEPDPAKLLYDDDKILRARNPLVRSRFAEEMSIPVLNHEWTLFFSTTPEFDAGLPRSLDWLALCGGLLVSLFLFAIACVQANARGRAEQDAAKLQKSEAALAAEKERLAVTLDAITDGVITTDAAGLVLSINQAAEDFTGCPENECFGKPLTEVFRLVHEQTRERQISSLERILQSGVGSDMENYGLLIARDGTERIITDSAALIRDQVGRTVGAVLVFRDITEKRKTEAETLKESKLESVGLLAGGIAHDFNNILTGIIGNISLARMSAHSTEKMLERLDGVEKAANRARDLTQQLLTFAKGGSPIRKWSQLPDLVRDVCQFALHGSNIQSEYSLPTDAWPVELDEGQFRQALNQVVIKAMQSMPDGGSIEVKLENVELTEGFLPPLKAGRYVKLSIRDHGPGIKPEHLPRIFEPYFSIKNVSGLGLATAYSIIRRHEGLIRVESTVGLGTVFQVYLPASQQAPPAATPSNQKQFLGHGRVLVMDDEPSVLEVAGAMLQMCGYEVETAREGGEAIERFLAAKKAGQPFDAVIMDLTIPNGMGGREAVRRLRELAPEARAIVSSGYSFDPVLANHRQYGFKAIITKPYRIEELSRVLREVLAGTKVEGKPEKGGSN